MKHNPVGWFEIPTLDFNRAIAFYEKIFGVTLHRLENVGLSMAMFPDQGESVGASGALVHNTEWYQPTLSGVLIYFTSPTGTLDIDGKAIEEAGGKVWIPKKSVGEFGSILIFEDTEGNRIGMHSRE